MCLFRTTLLHSTKLYKENFAYSSKYPVLQSLWTNIIVKQGWRNEKLRPLIKVILLVSRKNIHKSGKF